MNRIEHLLFKLAEEAAEVAQRASKAARFGLDEIQPSGSQGLVNPMRLNNRERIIAELNDLYAVVEMLDMQEIDRGAIEAHKAKVEHFLEYSRRCGTLTV